MEARDRYSVEFIATDQIKPSPENDDIYGTTNSDEHIDADMHFAGVAYAGE